MDTVMNLTGFLSLIPDTFCRNEPSLSLLLSYATPWKHSCIFPNRDNLQNLTFYNFDGDKSISYSMFLARYRVQDKLCTENLKQ